MLVACPYRLAIATALWWQVHEVEHATEAPMRLQTNGEVTMEELACDLERIRGILICCARNRRTITYSDLRKKIGGAPRGPWDELDAIAEYEKAHDRPDLTLVVVRKDSGLPSVYKDEALDPNDREGVKKYKSDLEGLFGEWDKAR